jgi:membrane fusion protein, multidrug efflux system
MSNTQSGNPAPPSEEEEQSIESVPLYRRARIVIPLLLVFLVATGAIARWYLGTMDFVTTDDAFVDGNRVTISAKILGRIDSLAADEGDPVTEGAVLVRLDDTDLRAQEAQSRAALRLAEENLTLAGVNLSRAQTDFKRSEQQFRESVIPREQFDHAQNELDAARTRQSIATAQISAAHAQLQVVQSQLTNTIIRAPMNGVVSKRWALPGDVVQPAQPILSVYNLDSVWVTANLEETKIGLLKPGDPVDIEVDAYPEAVFRGKVVLIGSNTAAQFSLIPPNNASGNFTKVTQRVPVKISIHREGSTTGTNALLPGMSVNVSIKVR